MRRSFGYATRSEVGPTSDITRLGALQCSNPHNPPQVRLTLIEGFVPIGQRIAQRCASRALTIETPLVSPDDFGKSNNVQWQQHHVREKDGRQPRDRAIGDEGEIAHDRNGA